LPRKPRRERKPIGPDANGLGPDGKPWDPERRARRVAERQMQVNAPQDAPVEEPSTPQPQPQPQPPTPAAPLADSADASKDSQP
jgi:hypothetical protein